jgi:hypothetical protein
MFTSIVFSGVSLFDTSTSQHVSAYLAIIKCIKIVGEVNAPDGSQIG